MVREVVVKVDCQLLQEPIRQKLNRTRGGPHFQFLLYQSFRLRLLT